jgi:hypothetical protein
MLIEARVLRGDDSVLEVRRDLAERNEFVMCQVGLVVNESLEAALDMDRGCRWVDPAGGYEGERG